MLPKKKARLYEKIKVREEEQSTRIRQLSARRAKLIKKD